MYRFPLEFDKVWQLSPLIESNEPSLVVEKVLWEGLSAFQIMCKITCENQFPSTKHLDNEIQVICNRCLIEWEKRSSSSEILLMLLQIEI